MYRQCITYSRCQLARPQVGEAAGLQAEGQQHNEFQPLKKVNISLSACYIQFVSTKQPFSTGNRNSHFTSQNTEVPGLPPSVCFDESERTPVDR